MTKPSVETMESAAKAVMPKGLFVSVNEVVNDEDNPLANHIHIMVHTRVYSQSYINPKMLAMAYEPGAVFANHVEMNVLQLREELEKILKAIDERGVG